jgi:hypothetical protein
MGQKASAAEKAAYGTACTIAARIAGTHPDIADDLRELLDAARTEQRLACKRGRPIYSQAENLAMEIDTFLRLSAPAGTNHGSLLDPPADEVPVSDADRKDQP